MSDNKNKDQLLIDDKELIKSKENTFSKKKKQIISLIIVSIFTIGSIVGAIFAIIEAVKSTR